MKRRLLIILFLLVLGAIVNIAVAWGCGRSIPDTRTPVYGDSQRNRNPFEGLPMYSWEYRGLGIAVLGVNRGPRTTSNHGMDALEDVWPWWISLDDLTLDEYYKDHFRGGAIAQGWPLFALYCEASPGRVEGGIELRPQRPAGTFSPWVRVIALRPIWPGFAINTVFYAALLWLLFAAPFALRRRQRIRSGLCPKCAYDLRNRPSDSTACPECGAVGTPR